MDLTDIQPGQEVIHKKGKEYLIIGVAVHTETEESLVIYSSFAEPNVIWARPLQMFLDGRFRKKLTAPTPISPKSTK